ncbi:MAG: AAA family ATPase [Byssovorax sp.]
MPRHFNTAGPNDSNDHYTLPAASRLPEARALIDLKSYFVVHAPRQTGKTTTLRALARELTAEGRYAALHFTCEEASVAGDDFGQAIEAILYSLRRAAEYDLPPELQPPPFPEAPPAQLLSAALKAWATTCQRPLVLVFDEIDSLVGESLISVLRQLRGSFPYRPSKFPWSIILCGLRDVRDYKLASGGSPPRLGSSSPFNIKVESSRLGDFSLDDVRALYAQHTAETGQVFTHKAILRAFDLSQGQPWLVNSLAREVVDKMKIPLSTQVTAAHIDDAKERLILARATHLDSLLARLREPRVKRIIEPMIAGDNVLLDDIDDDLKYVRDLGLVARKNPLRVANPIYREVIVRVLAGGIEANVTDEPRAFLLPDGRLAFGKLLRAFARFWREHGAALLGATPYHEVAPQLVLMAFLQRIVNGGGHVDREYGVGRGRIDLLVRFPYRKADGTPAVQRRALELKVWRPGAPDPLKKGLAQLDGYLAELGLRRGTLVIFDRRRKATQKPVFLDVTTKKGRAVRLLRA